MKYIIFLLSIFTIAYSQSFDLSDCLLKSRKYAETVIKPTKIVVLSTNEFYDMYSYNDSILVTYEKDILTYIEVTSSIAYAATQVQNVLERFDSDANVFSKVLLYDKQHNEFVLDVINNGLNYTIYVQLISTSK